MSGLGDTLDYMAGSLEKPGRAVRGLMYGRPHEALAAIPFSDTMGLTNPEDKVTGRMLTDKLGVTRSGDKGWGSWALGMGADMATDPLSYIPAHSVFKGLHKAGAFDNLGSKVGRFMGDEAGHLAMPVFPHADPGMSRAVNEAADWLGPRYDAAKGRDFLMDAIKTHRPDEGDMFGKIQRLSHNNQKRLFSEIHPDSKVLGAGSEGIAFGVPGGSVTRVGTSMSPFGGGYFSFANSGVPIAGRARIPEMLQPIRSNDFGGLANGIRVENLHRVMPMDDEVDALRGMMMRVNDKPGAREAGYALENTHYLNDDLAAHLMGSIEKAHPGLNAWDVAPRNVSTTPQGRLIVHDPSAVASTQVSFIPYHSARRPDEAMGMGLLRQGAPEDLRQAIARTAAEGPVGQGVEFPARTVDARGRIVDPGGERAKHLAHIRDFLVSSGSIPQGQSLFEAIMKHRGG